MEVQAYIKDRLAARDRWERIVLQMRTHLYGDPPEWLFISRRPLESTNEYALQYRVDNFQPITKQHFQSAVGSIIETASSIYVEERNVDDNTNEFLDTHIIQVAGKDYSTKDFVVKHVSRMLEGDPNAILCTIPRHPREEFVPRYDAELPDFNNVINEFVDLDIRFVQSQYVHYVDDNHLLFEGGEWVYGREKDNEKSAPFYWHITAEWTRLIIPVKSKEGHTYEEIDFYFNDLEFPPYDIVGHNEIVEDVHGDIISYKQSTYAGAVAIGNDVLGKKSDSDICTTRFLYPEKFLTMNKCGHPGCTQVMDPNHRYSGLYVIYSSNEDISDLTQPSCTVCPSCSGTGQVAPDTGPLGTHFVAKSEMWDETGKFVPPIAFITPPTDTTKILDDFWRLDLEDMLSALFIMRQNMTNQSGESRSYDWREKVNVITSAVRNIYDLYGNLLNSIQGFLRGSQDILLELPLDFNIKSSEELTIELSNSRNTTSAYTSELVKDLLLKKNGNTQENQRLLDFLELQDRIFGMTIDEILKMKAIYGPDLTSRVQVIHDKGWAILRKIAVQEDVVDMTDERLTELFNTEIDKIAPPPIQALQPSPIV